MDSGADRYADSAQRAIRHERERPMLKRLYRDARDRYKREVRGATPLRSRIRNDAMCAYICACRLMTCDKEASERRQAAANARMWYNRLADLGAAPSTAPHLAAAEATS